MNKKEYSAFTLIEMLVVMIILVILGSLSMAAYQDMQSVIRLNEYTSVLEENIRRVQREAMLLKREPGERWIYGLGIDLTKMGQKDSFGDYTVFKWCSSSLDYGDPKTTSSIPGYQAGTNYGQGNGTLPSYSKNTGACNGNEELRVLSGYDIGLAPPTGSFYISGGSTLGGGIGISKIGYILFESVTGRALFYGADRYLAGHENLVDPIPMKTQTPLEIRIVPLAGGAGKRILVLPFSGKITVEANDENRNNR